MALRITQPFFFTCVFLFFLLLLPLQSHARPNKQNGQKPSSASEFLKHLQGCHKGDNVTGLHELKEYLNHFGYLNYNNHHSQNKSHANEDVFDKLLEDALKTYQLNYHLKPTGTLDAETVSKMRIPRCGIPDIINGTNTMGKKRHHRHAPSSFHTVSHYAFFEGSPKWPTTQTHLTYGFLPGTGPDKMGPITRAFNKWASATQFTFSQAEDYTNANIKISFHRGNIRNGDTFDGPGNVVAHAWAPTDGRLHFDAEELWSDGPLAGYMDLETVALHEIGHNLGLGHSNVSGAIMEPVIFRGMVKGLNADDIQGIKALYGV